MFCYYFVSNTISYIVFMKTFAPSDINVFVNLEFKIVKTFQGILERTKNSNSYN